MNLTSEPTTKLQQLEAVLPLRLVDYPRFWILEKSLDRFCRHLIQRCWIVTPDRDFEELRSQIKDSMFTVISESALVPEFKIFTATGGWFRQQVIKLAIAAKVETDFYLTFDADVICVQPTQYTDLIKSNRAVCYIDPSVKAKFSEWYEWAERVLQLRPTERCHNLTPTILSREAVLLLQEHLSRLSLEQLRRLPKLSWQKRDLKLLGSQLLAAILPKDGETYRLITSWKAYLLRNLPWTEYGLYYSFLEAQGLFDKYHVETEHCIYSIKDSVWYSDRTTFPDWDAAKCFTGDRNYHFCIVQSNTKIDPQAIWQKVGPFLAAETESPVLSETR